MKKKPNTFIDLYRDMLRSRNVELRIERLYDQDDMKTPIHLYIGQEAVAAGVCAHLEYRDPIFTSYRGHGQYLSKGGDLKRMIAELHCKETGCSHGRGGSMHIIDIAAGHYGSSAIVAGCVPIATGMAMAKKMRSEDAVTTVFFGDGAVDEGVFYESVNFAMLKRLPVLFIIENNQWAVCSHISTRQPCETLYHHADPDMLFTASINGNDVIEVYETAALATKRIRDGKGPALIECLTYRLRGHNGAGTDTKLGHRTEEEIASWEDKCPIKRFRQHLIQEEVLSQNEIDAMEREIEREIDEAFAFAKESPLPSPDDLMLNLYRE